MRSSLEVSGTTAVARLIIAQPLMQALNGKPLRLPERKDRVFFDVVAEFVFAANNGDAFATDQ